MAPHHLPVIYLHGFASSPRSRKAQFFAEKLAECGFPVRIPDLAEGDFEHLSISRQLAVIERTVKEPAILIGSSMGGYLAALYAARHPEVDRVVLLAPAFGFHDLWTAELGPEKLKSWRENGTIPVFHYGDGRDKPLAYNLLEDAAKYEAFPDFVQPGLIFHGTEDPLVPLANSRSFAASRPNVRLVELRSGHELTDVLDAMWVLAKGFLVGDGIGKVL